MSKYDESRAAYRVLSPTGFYADDDTLYITDAKGDPAEIYWDGEPNEELEPLNELARNRMTAYLEKLDSLAREVAEKTGRPYTGRPRSFDGALEMATAVQKAEMGIMGRVRNDQNVAKIDTGPVAETGSVNPNKRGRGRPTKASLQINAA